MGRKSVKERVKDRQVKEIRSFLSTADLQQINNLYVQIKKQEVAAKIPEFESLSELQQKAVINLHLGDLAEGSSVEPEDEEEEKEEDDDDDDDESDDELTGYAKSRMPATLYRS